MHKYLYFKPQADFGHDFRIDFAATLRKLSKLRRLSLRLLYNNFASFLLRLPKMNNELREIYKDSITIKEKILITKSNELSWDYLKKSRYPRLTLGSWYMVRCSKNKGK